MFAWSAEHHTVSVSMRRDLANELPDVLGDVRTYGRQYQSLTLNEVKHKVTMHACRFHFTVLVTCSLIAQTHNDKMSMSMVN